MKKIEQLEEEIKNIKEDMAKEKSKQINHFLSIINTLILNTPTGDLRNSLTDLNILFHNIIEPV